MGRERSRPRCLPFAGLGSIRARQCFRFSRARRCLPPQKTFARALSRAIRAPERCHRWPTGTVAARAHRCLKTSTRPLGAPLSRALRRPHALLRLLQIVVSTSTTTDHSNIPDHRVCGWDGCRASESCLSIDGDRRRYAGPGVEKEPNLDIPHRDCSRRRLRPNPDRSGHLLSRTPHFALSGETRGRCGIAAVAPACTARATRGSCDARLPRRRPTFTNPRGLLSRGRPGGRWRCLARRKPH